MLSDILPSKQDSSTAFMGHKMLLAKCIKNAVGLVASAVNRFVTDKLQVRHSN